MNSKKKVQTPEKDVNKPATVEVVKCFSKERVNFTVENKYLKVFKDGDAIVLKDEILSRASEIKDCEIVDISFKEGHSRINFKIEISAHCRTAFTGFLSDYKSELKRLYKEMNEKPEKEVKVSDTLILAHA